MWRNKPRKGVAARTRGAKRGREDESDDPTDEPPKKRAKTEAEESYVFNTPARRVISKGVFAGGHQISEAAGLLYLGDTRGNRVCVFDREGALKKEIPGVKEPKGVAIGSSGQIFVSEAREGRVTVLDEDGTVARFWKIPRQTFAGDDIPDGEEGDRVTGMTIVPNGIAVADGLVFVCVSHSRSGSVRVYREDGTYVRRFGERGQEDGMLSDPQGICIANGQVFVADSSNRRVVVFTMEGAFVRNITVEDMICPTGVCVSDGVLFIAHGVCRVEAVSLDGDLLLGSVGSKNTLRHPKGVCVVDDVLYVTSAANAKCYTYQLVAFDIKG